MKTTNYQFDLMYQGQEHKDVMYNEAILKIDSLLNCSVVNFTLNPPSSLSYEEKYIITDGEHKNKICYFAHESKGIQYNLPYKNMIIYVIKANCFYIFGGSDWQKLEIGFGNSSDPYFPSVVKKKFSGISEKYTLSQDDRCHYLYLNGNTEINFGKMEFDVFTVIIKQNYQTGFDIKWPEDILWKNKIPIKITSQTNAIDLFRFHKLPESNHFLAELVHQNYQY